MGNQALSSSITRKYAVDPATPIASAGPLGLWSVYSASVKPPKDKGKSSPKTGSTLGQPVSIWVLRKADASKVDHPSITKLKPKEQRSSVVSHLVNGAKTLSKLRHPSLLNIIEILPDTNSHLAIVTEPVFASLANALKRYDGPAFVSADGVSGNSTSTPATAGGGNSGTRLAQGPPAELREFSMSEFEVCHGMHQIAEALRFLHEEGRVVHGNISPSSIIITKDGDWKLCGFGFSQSGIGDGDFAKANMFSQEACDEDNAATRQHAPPRVPLRPTINYAAPEICDASVTRRECCHASDVFSFACLLWELTVGMQAQDGTAQPLLQGRDGRVSTHRFKLSQLNPDQVIFSASSLMPQSLSETLRVMLNVDPRRRPSMRHVCSSPFFDSGSVKVLKIVSSLTASDTTAARQAQILAHLPKQLAQFPARVIRDRVLPTLVTMCATRSQTTPFVLPSLLFSARKLSRGEFDRTLAPVFQALVADLPKMAAQCTLILVENVQILLQQGSRTFTQSVVVPMVTGALRGGNQGSGNSMSSSNSRGQYYNYSSPHTNTLQNFNAADASRIRLAALAKVDVVADASPGHTFQKSIFPVIATLLLDRDHSVVIAALNAVRSSFRRLDADVAISLVLPAVEACIKKHFQNGKLCVEIATTYQSLANYLGAKCAAQKILPVIVRLLAERHFSDEEFIQYIGCVEAIVERVKSVRLGVAEMDGSMQNGRRASAGSGGEETVTDGAMPNLDFAVAAAAAVSSVSIDNSMQSSSFIKKELKMPPPQYGQRQTQMTPQMRSGNTSSAPVMGAADGSYAMMEDSGMGNNSMGDLLSLDMTPAPGGIQNGRRSSHGQPNQGNSGQWSSLGQALPMSVMEPQEPQDHYMQSSNTNSSQDSNNILPVDSLPSMGGLYTSGQGHNYGALPGDQQQDQLHTMHGHFPGLQTNKSDAAAPAYMAPSIMPRTAATQKESQYPHQTHLDMSGANSFNNGGGNANKNRMNQNGVGLDMFAGLSSMTNPKSQVNTVQDVNRNGLKDNRLDMFAGLSGIPSKTPTPRATKPRSSTSSSTSGFDFM